MRMSPFMLILKRSVPVLCSLIILICCLIPSASAAVVDGLDVSYSGIPGSPFRNVIYDMTSAPDILFYIDSGGTRLASSASDGFEFTPTVAHTYYHFCVDYGYLFDLKSFSSQEFTFDFSQVLSPYSSDGMTWSHYSILFECYDENKNFIGSVEPVFYDKYYTFTPDFPSGTRFFNFISYSTYYWNGTGTGRVCPYLDCFDFSYLESLSVDYSISQKFEIYDYMGEVKWWTYTCYGYGGYTPSVDVVITETGCSFVVNGKVVSSWDYPGKGYIGLGPINSFPEEDSYDVGSTLCFDYSNTSKVHKLYFLLESDNTVEEVVPFLSSFLGGMFDGMISSIKQGVEATTDVARDVYEYIYPVLNGITSAVDSVKTSISDFFSSWGSDILNSFTSLFDIIKKPNWFLNIFSVFDFSPVTDWFSDAKSNLMDFFGFSDLLEDENGPFAWLADSSTFLTGLNGAWNSLAVVVSGIPYPVTLSFTFIFCAGILISIIKSF